MTKPLKVAVRHQGAAYHAALEPGERADHLLLRSLYHFGIDPEEKSRWRLSFRDEQESERGVYLDRSVGEQMRDGAELVLERDVAGNRRPASGSY